MTKHDYKQHAYYIIYLIRCVLHDQIPKKEKLDKIDLSKLYEVAEKHSLTAITAYALESAGVVDERFTQAKAKAIRKNALFDIERQHILNEFEIAGIWYMPLKGIVMQEFYPRYGMRQMADNDILIDPSRTNDVKYIMESLGFVSDHFGGSNHDVYKKPPVCNFEMHNELFLPNYGEKIYEYYTDIKKRLIKNNDSNYGFHLSNEDLYIYITAHEYKHFYQGGTGLRNLVDRYVLLRRFADDLNMAYIEAELSKMHIKEYECNAQELSLKLFNGIKLSQEEKNLLDYYIFSGTYGNTENLIENRLKKSGGGFKAKIKYFADRFFVPISKKNPMYKAYKVKYPVFFNNKLLLPFLPFYRLYHSLKTSRRRILTEIKTLVKF